MIHYVYLSIIFLLLAVIALLLVRLSRVRRTTVSENDGGRLDNSMPRGPDDRFLTKAESIVRANISDTDFGVDEFSREMGMSRSNLYVKLKSLTEEAPLDFIRRIRFERACEMLIDGRYSVAEISEKVGFNSSSYFSVSFRKYFGCLPTEYVKLKNQEK